MVLKLELLKNMANRLNKSPNNGWTPQGIKVLIEYIVLNDKYSQYEDLDSWYTEYHGYSPDEIVGDDDHAITDEDIRNYIQDRGTLIEFDGGIIVSSF